MEDVEDVFIAPAKKLNSNQLEIVNFHRKLTEFWQSNSQYKSRITPKHPFRNKEHFGYSPPLNEDFDAELESFLKNRDSTLIPKELMYTNKVEFFNRQVDSKSLRQKLTSKLINMERKESELKTDESDHEMKRKSEMENSFNESEEVVGDYKYSFCEEEELDNENEYNY
ncbi:conserved hypothetical protein [Theileria orientalis strain Shintoku]|uniref:Uncharacterized protein n=1 Tax=Theileria orientalis strain Shintoku TaxID=869250 RepID=J4D9Z5_THEOR|nr:conserved hypothetical protein [Theileria orientalis strain Shintoku]PVC53625.1 hypothetical protein MACL_00003607 [Theileria orientalis]BAM41690.1 conserved hypothetical protein [Theileria orientalis strain Shintoku]|eukprot:XP_009691991.1 conserved hypothetical protein [Theileria orientalis strain Shintoku]